MRIYKYTLENFPQDFIPMPRDAKILDCNFQGENISFWAIVDEKAPIEVR